MDDHLRAAIARLGFSSYAARDRGCAVEVLLVLAIWVVPLLVAWGLIYFAVKYGVLNALRQHDRERRDAGPRG